MNKPIYKMAADDSSRSYPPVKPKEEAVKPRIPVSDKHEEQPTQKSNDR